MNRIGVIAANTNWKYANDELGNLKFGISPFSSGMFAWPCSAACPRMVRGSPRKVWTSGVPKPILNANSTHVMRVRQNVQNTIITVFIAHFFCTRPPYRTARPGMDISPTSVAAVSCQELSPAFSQLGYGIISFLQGLFLELFASAHFWVGLPGTDGVEGLPGGEAHIRSRFCPAAAAIAGRRCRLGNITGAVRE